MRLPIFKLTKIDFSVIFVRRYSDQTPQALRSLKPKSRRDTVQYYVDSLRVRTVAGKGGDGCVSFLHAWCKDNGGPNGGDGGNGGHVIFEASHSVKGLNHIKKVITAKNGERGSPKQCDGASAAHEIVLVPPGTVVSRALEQGVGEGVALDTIGARYVAARGGAGGRGNRYFVTDTDQSPEIAEYGAEGESLVYHIEVKSMAHVGLIGFPNAGKSTLLRAISRARPRVAPHPFTTVRPHLGMVPYSDHEQVTVADLPGLIPGSHKNRGLGIRFLKHAEHCSGLLYILDGSTDCKEQHAQLTRELGLFSRDLLKRQSYVVINKIDLAEARTAAAELAKSWDVQQPILAISAKTGEGLPALLKVIREIYEEKCERDKEYWEMTGAARLERERTTAQVFPLAETDKTS